MKNKEFTIHQGKQSQMDKLMDARQRMIDQVKKKNHRLEEVLEHNGVTYINDSSATTISSAKDSIRCITDPIVWIVEATDFERDFILLNKIAKYKVKAIVAYGIDTDDIKRDLSKSVDTFLTTKKLTEAIELAIETASQDDAVLFSPSCPAKGDYSNYSERGEGFKSILKEILNQ